MGEQLPSTIWKTKSRIDYQTKSRNYALGSFFSTVLTAITDTKDGMGIRIKTDPAYFENPTWVSRKEANNVWTSRNREQTIQWMSRVARD